MNTVIQSVLAPRTCSSYLSYFNEWKAFAQRRQYKERKPTAEQFIEFLQRIFDRTKGGSTVRTARGAVEAIAAENGWKTKPFWVEQVMCFCKGAVQIKPTIPKPPVTFLGWEALATIKQVEVPAKLLQAKTLFLAMLLGPWRLAETLTLRPNRLRKVDNRLFCMVQAKEGRGKLSWQMLEDAQDKRICPVWHVQQMAT